MRLIRRQEEQWFFSEIYSSWYTSWCGSTQKASISSGDVQGKHVVEFKLESEIAACYGNGGFCGVVY